MSTPDSAARAELAALARDHSWTRTAAFLDGLPDGADPEILLLAPDGVDAETLTAWIVGVAPARAAIRQAGLDAGFEVTLRHNRVVVAYPCGEPLTSPAVAAMRAARRRPADSYLIVLAGADAVATPEDLETVERNVWRLVVEADTAHAGQDLSAERFVLWSGSPVPDFLADRVARDRDLAAEWITGDEAGKGASELAAWRTAYALDIADAEAAETVATWVTGDDRAMAVRRIELAQGAATDGRALVTNRLRALSRSAETQIRDALRSLEQELIRGLPEFLDRRTGGPLEAGLDLYLRQGLRRWQSGKAEKVLALIERQSQDVPDIFDEIDWDAINRALGTTGEARYPHVGLRTVQVRLGLDTVPGQHMPPPPVADRSRPSGISGLVVTGALGAAIGFVFGGPFLMAVGGMAGLAGGAALHRMGAKQRDDQGLVRYARGVITARIGQAIGSLPTIVDGFVSPVETAAREEFDAIDADLATALRSAAQDGTPVRGGADDPGQRLRLLRARTGH